MKLDVQVKKKRWKGDQKVLVGPTKLLIACVVATLHVACQKIDKNASKSDSSSILHKPSAEGEREKL